MVFFTVTQFTGLLLLADKMTAYAHAHLFFLDFAVLLGISYFQASVRGEFKGDMKSRSIFNRRFLSQAGTMALYGAGTLAAIVWMLRKTKFYLSPQ